MDLTACPECGAAAEVERRDVLAGTDVVEHVKLMCVRRHWFLMPVFLLEQCAQWIAAPPLPDVARSNG